MQQSARDFAQIREVLLWWQRRLISLPETQSWRKAREDNPDGFEDQQAKSRSLSPSRSGMSRAKSSDDERLSNVGLSFASTPSGALISRIVPGSSAWTCGEILPGDRIVSIGGSSARLLTEEQLCAAASGPRNSTLHVVVQKRAQADRSGGQVTLELRRFQVGGIGIRFEKRRGRFVVTWLERNGAADRSGALFVGDEILMVDGELTDKMSAAEVIGTICGESSTTVTLGVVNAAANKDRRLQVRRVTLWREARAHERGARRSSHSQSPRRALRDEFASADGTRAQSSSPAGRPVSGREERSVTSGFSQTPGAPPQVKEVQLGEVFGKSYSRTPGAPAQVKEVQLGEAFGKNYSRTPGAPAQVKEVQLGEVFGKNYSRTPGAPAQVKEVQLGQVIAAAYSKTAGAPPAPREHDFGAGTYLDQNPYVQQQASPPPY